MKDKALKLVGGAALLYWLSQRAMKAVVDGFDMKFKGIRYEKAKSSFTKVVLSVNVEAANYNDFPVRVQSFRGKVHKGDFKNLADLNVSTPFDLQPGKTVLVKIYTEVKSLQAISMILSMIASNSYLQKFKVEGTVTTAEKGTFNIPPKELDLLW